MSLTVVSMVDFLLTCQNFQIQIALKIVNHFYKKKNQNKNIAIGNFDYLADFSV